MASRKTPWKATAKSLKHIEPVATSTLTAPKLKGAPNRSSNLSTASHQPSNKENKPKNAPDAQYQTEHADTSKPPSRRPRAEPVRFGDFTHADDALLSPEASARPAPPHAPTPSSVFEPDRVTSVQVDAITRTITDQLTCVVEDDGLHAEQERATAAAALRGALGGKTYYDNLKTRACGAAPSPSPAPSNPLAGEPFLQNVLGRSASTAAAEANKRKAASKLGQKAARAAKGTRQAKTASPPASPGLAQRLTVRAAAASPEILAYSETPAAHAVLKARLADVEAALAAKTRQVEEIDTLRERLAGAEASALSTKQQAAATLALLRTDLHALARAVKAAIERVDETTAVLLR